MFKFNIIGAVSQNLGIGIKNDLPWHLVTDLRYFTETTKRVMDSKKRNVVIMGRKTYFGTPPKVRPFRHLINIVLSKTVQPGDLPNNVICCPNLETAMSYIESDESLYNKVENIWIGGGGTVYSEAIKSPRCHRLYLTDVKATFDCDTFFPQIPAYFKEVEADPFTPRGIYRENGIEFEFKIFEKQEDDPFSFPVPNLTC